MWLRLAAVAIVAVWAPAYASNTSGSDVSPDCKSDSLRQRFATIARERHRDTMTETRAVGLALECFAIGRTAYPGPTPGLVKLEWLGRDIPELAEMPQSDVWGQPFRYWSDGAHYAIISYASDGIPDHDYGTVLAQPWEEAEKVVCEGGIARVGADVLFVDGNHCQWPKGSDG